ncbi:phosphate/phosphite/phosphonate ABC transporter substrate-binding protein [Bacillus pseudomycoides]|uniref:substrate-binding domain-containing protein n=1 Tax=Bacillus pseudomycoides TaxID=64104 RepID=UPI001FB32D11|nr:phosphate/phosphite/phosphonate ABC transporter substrate-binding protein [Bacillus pseudomycoides]
MINWLRLFFILLITLLSIGCQHERSSPQIIFSESDTMPVSSQGDKPSPIRIAISSVLSPTDTIMYYRKIANYIGEKLHRPVILIQRKSYNEISMLMMNGGADIAILSTGAYITYRHVEGLEAIAMQERMGVPYYYGYVVVNSKNELSSIHDLRGKNIAFSDPTSYSGFIFVRKKLAELSETPEHFFSRYVFTYNHESSLSAVINGVVDAAAVDSLVFERTKLKNPELIKDLKIIEKTEPIGTGPVVISSNLPDEEKRIIKESFISMHEQKIIKPAFQGLFIDRFVPFEPQLYEGHL